MLQSLQGACRGLQGPGPPAGTHHQVERAVGDVFSSKPDGDDVLPGLRSRVVNVKGAVGVLHHVHVQLRPVWSRHLTGDFTFPSSLCVHSDDGLLSDLDGRADT